MGIRKGWFAIDGVQDGDRTLAEQLKGLGLIDFTNETVLDLGCAEGLISKFALEHGAALVHGVDIIQANVEEARLQCKPWGLKARFTAADVATMLLLPHYEIVLMLAILHKVKRPAALLGKVIALNPALCVVRLPAGDGVIIDARSGSEPCDVPAWFVFRGYQLQHVARGHFNEWVGYFQRKEQGR